MKHIINNTVKLLVLAVMLGFTACEDVFSPSIENIRGIDAMYQEPTYAQGIWQTPISCCLIRQVQTVMWLLMMPFPMIFPITTD